MPESATIEVLAESPGIVIHIVAQPGSRVDEDDELLIVECMKMEIPVTAPRTAVVREVKVAVGDRIEEDDVLVILGVDGG